METDLFDYELPESSIAQTPAERRDGSRLLVVERAGLKVGHHRFGDLPDLLPAGTSLFRNNASVLKARLRARRPTGGAVECLLLRPSTEPDRWWCLLRPGRRLQPGARFGRAGLFEATVEEKRADGECLVAFATAPGETVTEIAARAGEMPLPPYIRRGPDDPRRALDNERYQTVYADPDRPVAAAAPTAGLHFTPAVLARLADRGIPAFDLELQVGAGTFRPIESAAVEEHPIHREAYAIPPATARALLDPAPGPRLAVGTTTLRAAEDFFARTEGGAGRGGGEGIFRAEAELFIYPPATFQVTDALLTNFHLPRSTLLCLVAAFLTPGETAGIKSLIELYREAIACGYRFYSYGDAMLVL